MTKYVVAYFEGVEKIVSTPASWLNNTASLLGEPVSIYNLNNVKEVNAMLDAIANLDDVKIRRLVV